MKVCVEMSFVEIKPGSLLPFVNQGIEGSLPWFACLLFGCATHDR